MSNSSMKTYQVEYLISMRDEASSVLKTLANNAESLKTPMEKVSSYIREVQSALMQLRNNAVSDLVIKPSLDTVTIKAQFSELEKEAKKSASIIAKMMSKAMMGVNPQTNLTGEATKESIKKRIDENKKAIKTASESVAKALRQENELLKKDMKYAQSAASSNNIVTSFSNLAKDAQKLQTAGTAIGNIAKNIKKLDTSKSYVIKVDADISPAVRKINTLLETVRTNVAALPITIAEASKKAVAGTKAGDAISKKTGKATATGKSNTAIANISKISTIEKALKGQKAVANLSPQFDGNTLVAQLIQTVEKLQTAVKEKPITIRSAFNGVDAAFQFHMTIHRLQELANEKPIVLKSVLSSAGANPGTNNTATTNNSSGNSGTASSSSTEKVGKFGITQKEERFWERHQKQMADMNIANRVDMLNMEAKRRAQQTEDFRKDIESRIGRSALHQQWVNNDKLGLSTRARNNAARAEKAANIKAYEDHMAAMESMRADNDAAYSKLERKYAAQQHAARQAGLNDVFGRDALHQQWVERDKAGLSTRARNYAKRAEEERIRQYQSSVSASRERARIARMKMVGAYGGWVEPSTYSESGMMISNGRRNSGGGGVRGIPVTNQTLYNRAKTFWYPFTGNTSFGAQTPAAISMAKGMGSMMAIGGAMSAVGSSLNQSVAYQNMMKTTQAILENGTKTYSDSGFREMEQVVRQVGKETKFTAPQVASAAKFLAMAGYDIPAIKSAINPVANIALIGDTNLGETADKLTNVMTTFGIEPEKMNDIADIMTSTFTRSNTDMMMLAESAKYAGGIANLYGGNFQNNFADVMAMFGALGNAGIQASSAGTTLRMMYQNLMQPNKNQKATLKKYGINPRDSSGQPLEMVEILKQIMKKVPTDKIADAVGSMFRITAQPGAAALVQSLRSGKLVELMEANRNAAGTNIAQSIADEKKNTLAGLWAQVSSAFTEAILQAVEGREGGWAGLLGDLRDYLSKPETIQALSSVVDLVERLMKMFAGFAKIWAKIYSMFPGVINGWMHFQMLITQFGYLVTPIIQLISILDRLKISILGVSGVTAAASAVGKGGLAAGGGVMLSAMSGSSRYVRNGDTAAQYATYAAALETLNNRKTQYRRKANILRNSIMWQGERIESNVMWPMAAATFGHPQNIAQAARFNRNQKMADLADKGVLRTQDKINALKNQRFAALKEVRRPDQLANRALMTRYAAIVDRSVAANGANTASNAALALISTANNGFAARDTKIAEAAKIRRSARDGVSSDVRKRFMGRYGFGKAAKMSFASNFSAGRVAGTFSLATMFVGFKNMILGLFSTIAKALGLLISPAGLVVTALAAVGTALYLHKKHLDEYRQQMRDNANKYAESAQKARKADLKAGENLREKADKDFWKGRAPIVAASASQTNTSKLSNSVADTKKKYQDALEGSQEMATANRKWMGSMMSSAEGRLGFYNEDKSIVDNFAQANVPDNKVFAIWDWFNAKKNEQKLNEESAKRRAGLTLQYRGAIAKSTIDARAKILELFQQYQAGKIDRAAYWQEANKFLPNVKNPSLLDATKYTSQQIANSAPERFSQYQMGVYNAINAEIQGNIGSLTGRLQAVEDLKSGVTAFSDKWYNSVAHIVSGMQSSIETIKGKVTVTLSTLPNGQIDVAGILAQVRAKVAGFNLTISQFSNLVSGVYSTLVQGGFVKGKYYSDYIKFAKKQTEHMTLTKEDAGAYFDTYVAKGDANAKWGNFNRQQYIDWVTNINDHGRAASERNHIRNTLAINAAISAKKQTAEALKRLGGSTGDNNTTNSGKGGGGSTGVDDDTKKQKNYASTYDRSASHPTQVIIRIENLARFDGTTIAKNADDRAIASAIEYKIAEAVSMLSAQALNVASSTISQGLS